MEFPTDDAGTQQSNEATASLTTPDTTMSGPLFVAACVILPVIWGIVVHLVFTWLRKKYRSENDGAPAWPDYQI